MLHQKSRRQSHSEHLLLRNQHVEVQPGLFEGDLLINNKNQRLGYKRINYPEKFWKKRTAPYIIHQNYTQTERNVIEQAIQFINYMTCIKLKPWDGKDRDYIDIRPDTTVYGCFSHVGRKGGRQILGLNRECMYKVGTPMHEIMHTLGTFHEHNRWDRDEHVIINYQNILEGYESNFNKLNQSVAWTKYPYDCRSVMHYGKDYFSINKKTKPTIISIERVDMGQREGMTALDCLKLNDLYGCLSNKRKVKMFAKICNTYGVP